MRPDYAVAQISSPIAAPSTISARIRAQPVRPSGVALSADQRLTNSLSRTREPSEVIGGLSGAVVVRAPAAEPAAERAATAHSNGVRVRSGRHVNALLSRCLPDQRHIHARARQIRAKTDGPALRAGDATPKIMPRIFSPGRWERRESGRCLGAV